MDSRTENLNPFGYWFAGTRSRCIVHRIKRYAILLLIHIFILAYAGCSSLQRNPIPLNQIQNAEIAGMPGVRGYFGELNPYFQKDFIKSILDEDEDNFPRKADGSVEHSALALSGGGAFGAFGAGFLNGWTVAGTRPKFKLVTGISTGALIAPFAFVGSEYDENLKKLFTSVSTKDIFTMRGMGTIGSESIADTAPLARLLEQSVDETLLKAVAEAHTRGRRLYIGTTNLDAQRPVAWNMGAIASSGHPEAPKLFREVMLASASIPVALPPVYIEVEADGVRYDEMHVDGGVVTEVFFHGMLIDIAVIRRDISEGKKIDDSKIYIIRNSKIEPEPEQIPRKLSKITDRTISTMTKVIATNDLQRIHFIAQQEGIDFNYVGIPEDFEDKSKEPFDPVEMNRLFDLGFQLASKGYEWRKSPPILSKRR
jgi:predicted patatin/cPLA2 family phospholipase